MSLKQHIADLMASGQRILEVIIPLPAAKEHPCKCCGGRGAIATITQFYRLDSDMTPVEKVRGGEVRGMSVMECPACKGCRGVDREAALNVSEVA